MEELGMYNKMFLIWNTNMLRYLKRILEKGWSGHAKKMVCFDFSLMIVYSLHLYVEFRERKISNG